MDNVNEKTTSLITVAFRDENGGAVTPSAASYRIDDALSGAAIRPLTDLGPGGPSVEITITDAENRILVPENSTEERLLTVFFTYGAGKKGNAEYRYIVKNLSMVT